MNFWFLFIATSILFYFLLRIIGTNKKDAETLIDKIQSYIVYAFLIGIVLVTIYHQ